MGIECTTNKNIAELYRGLKQQAPSLLGVTEKNMGLMSLGLAHRLVFINIWINKHIL